MKRNGRIFLLIAAAAMLFASACGKSGGESGDKTSAAGTEKAGDAASEKSSENGAGSTAAESEKGSRTVTDMAGNQVTVPEKIERYADAWYAHNEVICMLDQAKGLVATSQTKKKGPWMYYVQPNMNNALSTFGDQFNLEELVAKKPDLVFDSKEDYREQLNAVGIPLVNVMFKNYDEMKRSVSLTGEILGEEQMASDYCAYLDGVLAELKEKLSSLSEEQKPKVLHGNSVYSFSVDGSDTIIDAWISAAGGRNAASSVKGNMQTVTLEQILEWDPDYIITGTSDEVEKILKDPNWSGLRAVQEGKVYANPKGVFSWDRYGVEEALQLQWAAALLHPDLFQTDIKAKIREFYQKFLNFDLTEEQAELILQAKPPEEN